MNINLTLIVQMIVYYLVRIPVPDVAKRIAAGELAPAIWLGLASLTGGLLSAAVQLATAPRPQEKGWGFGGGLSGEEADPRVRHTFSPIAYYAGALRTDANGDVAAWTMSARSAARGRWRARSRRCGWAGRSA